MNMESSSRYRAGFTSGVSVYLTASRQTSNGTLDEAAEKLDRLTAPFGRGSVELL
jgi:hypothetical protein